MPDAEGKLDDKEREQVISWLRKRFPQDPSCPLCGGNDWTVGEYLGSIIRMSQEHTLLGGPAYPCVVVVCKDCAYTLLLNAVKIELLRPSDKVR